jgi:hypothetical protein
MSLQYTWYRKVIGLLHNEFKICGTENSHYTMNIQNMLFTELILHNEYSEYLVQKHIKVALHKTFKLSATEIILHKKFQNMWHRKLTLHEYAKYMVQKSDTTECVSKYVVTEK